MRLSILLLFLLTLTSCSGQVLYKVVYSNDSLYEIASASRLPDGSLRFQLKAGLGSSAEPRRYTLEIPFEAQSCHGARPLRVPRSALRDGWMPIDGDHPVELITIPVERWTAPFPADSSALEHVQPRKGLRETLYYAPSGTGPGLGGSAFRWLLASEDVLPNGAHVESFELQARGQEGEDCFGDPQSQSSPLAAASHLLDG